MGIYEIKKPKRINSVSVSVTILAFLFGYLLWFAIPTWWPSFQMGGLMRGACHDAYRIIDDDVVIKKLVKDSQRLGLKITAENFRMTRVPYTPPELTALKVPSDSSRAKRGKRCVMEFYYEADFPWPLIKKTSHITFEKRIEDTLEQVTWD